MKNIYMSIARNLKSLTIYSKSDKNPSSNPTLLTVPTNG